MNESYHYVFRPDGEKSAEFTVRRVWPQYAYKYVGGISIVMTIAYARQFEDVEDNLLPSGTAQKHFKPDDENYQQNVRLERMKRYMEEQGSAYWVAFSGSRGYNDRQQNMLGVVKTSPSRPGIRKLGKVFSSIDNPNCYVNDLAVVEPGKGLGSTLLSIAMKDYDPKRKVVADVLPGSEGFFEQRGFQVTGSQSDLEIGDDKLGVIRFEAPRIQTVQNAIVERLPWVEQPVEE